MATNTFPSNFGICFFNKNETNQNSFISLVSSKDCYKRLSGVVCKANRVGVSFYVGSGVHRGCFVGGVDYVCTPWNRGRQ